MPSGDTMASRAAKAPPSAGVTDGQRTSVTRLAMGSTGSVISLPIIQTCAEVTQMLLFAQGMALLFGRIRKRSKTVGRLVARKKAQDEKGNEGKHGKEERDGMEAFPVKTSRPLTRHATVRPKGSD